MKLPSVAAALAVQVSVAAGQFATYAPSDPSISYMVNVPDASAQSGSGDIFFQIKGPISGSNARSWIALGQGTTMPGANIFIVYPNQSGNNVTLSPRLGMGFFEPNYDSAAKVELIGGTGIENGIMTANIKCSNCNSWNGGSMSFTDSASTWIWSSAAYGAINSDDTSFDIQMHNERGPFTFDLTKATGGSSANPFAMAAAASSPSSPSTNPTTSGSSSGEESDGASSSGGPSVGALSMIPNIVRAHASVMSLSFLFFYPLGAIIMRIGVGSNTMWIHAALQGFAYLLAITGMGLGIWLALTLDYLHEYHAIIGLVTVCLLVLQAPLGLLHHMLFKKKGGRTGVSYVHIWLGRALMTLGAINGGFGLQLAYAPRAPIIAYGVLAGVIYVGYYALIAGTFGKGKKNAAKNDGVEGQKRERASEGS